MRAIRNTVTVTAEPARIMYKTETFLPLWFQAMRACHRNNLQKKCTMDSWAKEAEETKKIYNKKLSSQEGAYARGKKRNYDGDSSRFLTQADVMKMTTAVTKNLAVVAMVESETKAVQDTL